MLAIGDRVEVVDEALRGIVVKIQDDQISIETIDGFELVFSAREVVKVGEGKMEIPSVEEVQKIVADKEIFKSQPKKQLKRKKVREAPPMEVDLHIHKLVKSTKGMLNHDMVTLQLDTAKRQLDFAISKRIPRVVFIHGVGQGVLKEELRYLFGRYDNLQISDADYKKYGLGAMEVYIIQNPK